MSLTRVVACLMRVFDMFQLKSSFLLFWLIRLYKVIKKRVFFLLGVVDELEILFKILEDWESHEAIGNENKIWQTCTFNLAKKSLQISR